MSRLTKQHAFTLLEVLISFAVLSILLSVIIQTQSESILFTTKTGKMEIVRHEVHNQLMALERKTGTISDAEGTFPDDHVLAGDRWQRRSLKDFFFAVPITRVIYRITWSTPKGDQFFESSIFR